MRKSRFSEEQIVSILKEHAAGENIGTLCRRHGISQQTLYRWKHKYDGLKGKTCGDRTCGPRRSWLSTGRSARNQVVRGERRRCARSAPETGRRVTSLAERPRRWVVRRSSRKPARMPDRSSPPLARCPACGRRDQAGPDGDTRWPEPAGRHPAARAVAPSPGATRHSRRRAYRSSPGRPQRHAQPRLSPLVLSLLPQSVAAPMLLRAGLMAGIGRRS